MSRDLRFGQVEHEVEVVNEQEVDPVHAKPHLRLLVGPHDAVVAVVMHVIETEPACPRFRLELIQLGRRIEPASDFGRENEFGSRLRVKKTAAANLRQAPTIIRCCIVVTNTGSQAAFSVAAAVGSSTRTKSSPSGALPKPSWVSFTPVFPSSLVSNGFISVQPPSHSSSPTSCGRPVRRAVDPHLAPADRDGAVGSKLMERNPNPWGRKVQTAETKSKSGETNSKPFPVPNLYFSMA